MRDLSQQMMRASTSFAEGAFILLQRRSLEFKTEPILPRVLPQSDFSSFFGCSACFFYPPLLFSKREGGEEVSMFLRTRFSALRDRKRGRERKRGRRFSARAIERERERSESVEYVFFFLSIIDPPFSFSPCLLYTSPSPRDQRGSRMPSSA